MIVLDPLLAAVTTVSLDSPMLLLEDGYMGSVFRGGTGYVDAPVLSGIEGEEEELRLDAEDDGEEEEEAEEEEFADRISPLLAGCDVPGDSTGS